MLLPLAQTSLYSKKHREVFCDRVAFAHFIHKNQFYNKLLYNFPVISNLKF